MSDSKNFNIGDSVVLNSGGPDMKVLGKDGDFCTCEWSNGTEMVRKDFNKLTLTLLKKAE
ncbi:MAG: DUF2158 domain-containing protein [bacterium]